MEQLDLFAASGVAQPEAQPDRPLPPAPALPPEMLSDEALLTALPGASRAACDGLAAEAARRGLAEAVPALEALCRRFKGFGQQRVVPEQRASLQALAALGGAAAAAAVRRLIADGVVAGPGQHVAMQAAATLRCTLPDPPALSLLQHADPEIRALACRCAPRAAAVSAVLASLLQDLNPAVAAAAAIALGRRGAVESRPHLLHLLRQSPTPDLLDALAGVADDDCIVLIARIARQRGDLRPAAAAALEAIETPRALALAAALRRPDGP